MGTRAINPLGKVDLELIEYWVFKKMETVEGENERFNQANHILDDSVIDEPVFGEGDMDYGEYFDQWSNRFSELLEARLIDVEDLQDFFVWIEYISPGDEGDDCPLDNIKSKLQMKIEGIEKREN